MMRILGRLLASTAAGIAVAALLSAPPAEAANGTTWSQEGFNAGRTLVNPDETVLTPATVRGLHKNWEIVGDQGDCSESHLPVISGNRLFFADAFGVGAYSVVDGTRQWFFRYTSPQEISPHLAVLGGKVFVGNQDCESATNPQGFLRALDEVTGALLWQVTLPWPVQTMVVDRGTVVASGTSQEAGRHVGGFRADTGAPLWSRADATLGPPVSGAGRVPLSGDPPTGVDAVGIRHAVPLWSRPSTSVSAAGPAGEKFFGGTPTGLAALDSSSGAVLWSTGAGQSTGDLAVGADTVYQAREGRLTARNSTTGAVRWSIALRDPAFQPVVAGGVVYLVTGDLNHVATYRASNGAFLTRIPTDGRVAQHVLVVGGRMFVLSRNTLFAYTL